MDTAASARLGGSRSPADGVCSRRWLCLSQPRGDVEADAAGAAVSSAVLLMVVVLPLAYSFI